MTYYRTQREKNEAEASLGKALANLPRTVNEIGRNRPAVKAKPKRKYRKPPSGFKLGDAMPEELRAIGLQYREKRNRGKIRKSNNKGDQRYVKRQEQQARSN